MTGAAGDRLPRRGLTFRCLPDSGVVRASVAGGGAPVMRLPGQMHLRALDEAAAARAFPVLWHAKGARLALPAGVEAVVNLVTSAEHCAQGLADLDAALPAGLPVLNHPRAVALARPDLAEAVFGQVTGMSVPRTRRLVATGPGAFQAAFAQHGFRFPVTVEPLFDDGRGQPYRIAHPGDWQHLFAGPWGGRAWLMVQAAEAPTPWRMLLGAVGKTGHAEVFNTNERVPPLHRPAPPPQAKALARDLMAAVAACLPLDCWTVEVALGRDGVALERLSAGLPVVAPTAPATPRTAALRKLRGVIEPAVAGLLARPGAWRAEAARLPQVGHTLALHAAELAGRMQ